MRKNNLRDYRKGYLSGTESAEKTSDEKFFAFLPKILGEAADTAQYAMDPREEGKTYSDSAKDINPLPAKRASQND